MSEIYNTTRKGDTIRSRRYKVQQQTRGERDWYGENYHRSRFMAVVDAWISGTVSGAQYNFRVVDTWSKP